MYLGIDIGGTKTLLGVFSDRGTLKQKIRFETPKDYENFLAVLQRNLRLLTTDDFKVACVAAPGKINRISGVVTAFGNLPWKNAPLQANIEKIVHAPAIVENDANLAGLYESKNIVKSYKKILYVTISTGIGTGVITDGIIDPELADSEGGHLLLEYGGKLRTWESFASGKAIQRRFGKQARDIYDHDTWQRIARDISRGMIDLIAMIQPDIIIIGGGVGTHFERFDDLLRAELKKFETPLTPVPPLRRAKRPEEAALYGCYELIRGVYKQR